MGVVWGKVPVPGPGHLPSEGQGAVRRLWQSAKPGVGEPRLWAMQEEARVRKQDAHHMRCCVMIV